MSYWRSGYPLWLMARSTRAEKARRLNTARGLLQRQLALRDAVRRLSRGLNLSERQAYPYLKEASHLDRLIEAIAPAIPIMLKLPPRTVAMLRKQARSSGLTMGIIVTDALRAFLRARQRHG